MTGPTLVWERAATAGAHRPGEGSATSRSHQHPEVTLTRKHRLAVASALAAGLLPATLVVVAPAAMAEPRPQHHAAEDLLAPRSKAHSEYLESHSAQAEHPSKAWIEYQERIQNGSVSESSIEPVASEEFPWAVAGLAALGIAAVAASGLAASRHGRQMPRSA